MPDLKIDERGTSKAPKLAGWTGTDGLTDEGGNAVGHVYRSEDGRSWIASVDAADFEAFASQPQQTMGAAVEAAVSEYRRQMEEQAADPKRKSFVEITTANGAKASDVQKIVRECLRAGQSLPSVSEDETTGRPVYYEYSRSYRYHEFAGYGDEGLRDRTFLVEDGVFAADLVSRYPHVLTLGAVRRLPLDPEQFAEREDEASVQADPAAPQI